MKAIIKSEDIIAAQPFASKDDSQPILTGIRIEVTGGRAEVVATDSYRLVAISSESDDNEDGGVTLDLSGMKLKRKDHIIIESDDESATVQSILQRTSTTIRVIEGQYPNWRQLMPERGTKAQAITSLAFNPSFVTDLGKSYRAWCGNNKAHVSFEFASPMKPFVMRKVDGDREFFGLIMPVRDDMKSAILDHDGATEASHKSSDGDVSDLKGKVETLEKMVEQRDEMIEQLKSRDDGEKLAGLESKVKKLEKLLETAESQLSEAKGQGKADDVMEKVDALIAEFGTIGIVGETPCGIYLSGIGKGSEEMEAAKAAGASFGNHKRYGKCWYFKKD